MSSDFPRFREETFLEDIQRWVVQGGSADAVQPQSGWSLLHFAAEFQDVIAIDYLIHLGVDPNRRDLYGQTPLHIAVDSEIDGTVQPGAPLEYKVTRRLVELGASPTIADAEGKSPLDWIAAYGDEAIKRYNEVVGKPDDASNPGVRR
jgi:ankyrin repeat protein